MTLKRSALLLQAGAALSVLMTANVAHARQRHFELPAGDAKKSIPEFARQADIQIAAATDQLDGVRTPAVIGTMDEQQALSRLLQGTELRVAYDDGNMIVIRDSAVGLIPISAQQTSTPESAPAPETPANAAGSQLQDVVVTAQRRTERLQDVPIAVTAFSQEQMERQRIVDIKSLSAIAPNVYTGGTTLDASALAVSIRGINSLSLTILQEPGVGVYIDGVYLPRTDGANIGMIDLQQVEVLRGAQGTLFGRNTLGGALSLTTNQPTDRFEGSLTATLGNYNQKDFTGVVNVPIIPGKIDARLVYAHLEREGYTDNTYLGTDAGADSADFLRFSLKANLTDAWTLSVTADKLWDDQEAQPAKVLYVRPGSLTAAIPAASGNPTDSISNYISGDLLTDQANFNPLNPLVTSGASATLTGDLSFATFKNIVGYRHMDVLRNQDSDGTPYTIIHNFGSPATSNALSEEAQLFGKALDDRLDWIAGAYYFIEHGGDGITTQALPAITNAMSTNSASARNTSYAVYGQITYALTPQLKFTAGVRYTEDDKRVRWISNSQNLATGVVTCTLPVVLRSAPGVCESSQKSVKLDYVPYTLKLAYQPAENINLYTSYTEGFRSGGFPSSGAAVADAYLPFDTEKTESYEAGAKAEWFDGRLRTNAAIYSTKYDNIQLSTIQLTAGGVPFASVVNSGSGKLNGAEIEVSALLGQLELNGSYGVLDAKYESGPYLGRPFLIVPEQTASVGATYPVDTAIGVLTLHADYNWRSEVQFQYNSPAGSITDRLNGDGSLGLLNASMSLDLANLPTSIVFWGKNLTDERYLNWVSNNSQTLGGEYGIVGAPLTFGATLRYKFGS